MIHSVSIEHKVQHHKKQHLLVSTIKTSLKQISLLKQFVSQYWSYLWFQVKQNK